MNLRINTALFSVFPQLESERLLFQSFSEKDAYDLFLIRSNDKIMEYMDRNKMASVNEAKSLIFSITEAFKNKYGISWRIIEKNASVVIGYFGFWRIMAEHCRAEIGYALKPDYWGKGYMLEALNRMKDFGFKELKLHSIEANVNPLNIKSISLLEKAGFTKEAHFRENILFGGKYLDSVIYSLIEPEK